MVIFTLLGTTFPAVFYYPKECPTMAMIIEKKLSLAGHPHKYPCKRSSQSLIWSTVSAWIFNGTHQVPHTGLSS